MAVTVLKQVKQALTNLNPAEVRETASRPVRIGLVAASQEALGRMEEYLVPPHLSPERRAAAARLLIRGGDSRCDVLLYESALLRPAEAFPFDFEAPEESLRHVLKHRDDLLLPLARHFYPFRAPASNQLIRTIAKENAIFCLMTALPDIVPGLGSIPWAVGEYGSDAAFLTMNQIRLGFLLAAASDRDPGYREQKTEIASMIVGAVGWRALARELVGKIPFGGGLIPKAAIAWTGTYVAGVSLERLYRLGYGLTRRERRALYEEVYGRGREIAGMLLEGLRNRRAV
jgi:hypothetical protein